MLRRCTLLALCALVLLCAACAGAPVVTAVYEDLDITVPLPDGWNPLFRGDADAFARAFPQIPADLVSGLVVETDYDGYVLELMPAGVSGGGEHGILVEAWTTEDTRLAEPLQNAAELSSEEIRTSLEQDYAQALLHSARGEFSWEEHGDRSWLRCDVYQTDAEGAEYLAEVRYYTITQSTLLICKAYRREGMRQEDLDLAAATLDGMVIAFAG